MTQINLTNSKVKLSVLNYLEFKYLPADCATEHPTISRARSKCTVTTA